MADKEQKVNAKVEEEEPKVPVTEVVIGMAPHSYTREQVFDILKQVEAAKAKGLSVRFA